MSTHAESYGTALSVQDDTYLNVAIPNSVVLNITPTAAGQFAKTSMDISVDTNNATGYTLTMTADTTSLSRTSAVNGVDYSIPTLSSATTCTDESDTTCDTFPVGYWGYKFTNAEVASSSTYNPISTDVTKLRFQKDFNSSVDTTTVTFGTKLSNSIPNGTYDGVNFTFIATTNYVIPETAKYMQDFNAVIADSLTPGITYTTKDSRDNQDYTVAKLADGNVWMTKNLNLAGGTTVTPANSNVAENYTLPNSTFGGFDYETKENGYVYNSGSTDCASSVGCYSYYSYNSATAKSGLNISTSGVSAPYDICPKGWRMPRSPYGAVPTNEFYNLALAYGMPEGVLDGHNHQTVIQAIGPGTVPNFVLNGYSYNQLEQLNESGSYRSSTFMWYSGNEKRSGKLYFSPADGYYISTSMGTTMREGTAVRCIKDRSMQNFSSTDAAAMSEGQTITLVDNRDNKEYKVTKINGRVWMTQNLAFTGTTLTPADSNVSENTTMTYYSLDSSDDSYADHCDSSNGYNYACIKDSGSTETGVWYNYAAASAGTITSSSNTTPATSSLCPSGWHIPTGAPADTSSEFYKIFQSTAAGSWIETNAYLASFNAVPGGAYRNGSLISADYGNWWSSIASNATIRYRLIYGGGRFSSDNNNRFYGYFVRCIFSGE